ncbi:MAG: hypothetical protein HY719_17460 [Planctomycetes bacterium]|nr:hypothetical protein [Planctomycetota bacterium]
MNVKDAAMDPMMQAIRRAKSATPFTPFTIELSSGTTLAVTHPETIALGEGGFAVIYRSGGVEVFPSHAIAHVRLSVKRRKKGAVSQKKP